MEYMTFLKIMHLTGVIAGFGGALYTDFLILTGGILKPLNEQTLTEVKRMARFVASGLLLLWLSGIVLAYEIILKNPNFLNNDKFWAKVAIVGVLTLNGIFIHGYVLRAAKKSLNKRLLVDSSLPVFLILTLSGALSFVSWVIPFILGKSPEFSYVIPFENIMAIWFATVLILVAGILTLVSGATIVRSLIARHPASGTSSAFH